jgi:hypothetical protein
MRCRALVLALLAGTAITMPTPARADPVSAVIVAAIGLTGTAAAIATTVLTLVLTTVGGILANSLFGPKRNGQERQASVASLSIGEFSREAIFGEAATGGSLADAFNYGGKNGTDWEVLIVIVADHRCHSLSGFYVNDQYYAFTGDGEVAGFSGQLRVYWRDGADGQTMPSVVTTQGGWTANDELAGLAKVVVEYKADAPDAKNPVWPSGRPNFLWVVKGKHCYIPRLDSTVAGGSGPHRWDDPGTWEWTDNVIDCRYNWMRGVYARDQVDDPGMLLVGRGLSAIEAPPERTIAAANTCDELVALKAGGAEKRYRFNGVVRATDPFIETEELFGAACAGLILQRQGGVEIEPGTARSVVAELTDTDFIVGEPMIFNRFRSDKQRVNSVIPRYVEAAQRWADHAAPIRRSIADVIADGGPREDALTLSGVTSNTQAQRIGEIKRRLARLERSGSGTLGPRFAELEEGDWVGWTSERHLKGERHVFRVSSYNLGPNWRNRISFEEVAAVAYSWNPATDEASPGDVVDQSTPPTQYGAPGADAWELAAITSEAGGLPGAALRFTGAADDIYATAIVFEYRTYDAGNGPDDGWQGQSVAPTYVVERILTGLEGAEDIEGAVSYQYGAIAGARRVLGPVTTPVVELVIDGQVPLS